MQFSLCFNESLLPSGKRTGNKQHRINAVDRYIILVVGMEMRRIVLHIGLSVHANDDTKEARKFRHIRADS